MSRIGKKPVALVKGVSATISGQTVEVKGPKTRISPEQQNFIDRVRSAGGLAGIARSVEDAMQITHN